VILLGLSGLPNAQSFHLRQNPQAAAADRRICQGMDSAACIVADGKLLAAAAEERFSGEKGTGALPLGAIRYCLEHAGISADDVDVIAHGFNYDKYRRFFHRTPDYFDQALSGKTVVAALSQAGWRDVGSRFRQVDHHVAHSASAYHLSGYENALSIVSDGMGEIKSLTIHRFTRGRIEELHSQGIHSSLGILYSIITRFLGYTFNADEYKVMGLSAYGDAAKFAPFFDEFMVCQDGAIRLAWPKGALGHPGQGYPGAMEFLEHSLDVPARDPATDISSVHADIAAAFQARFSAVLTQLAGCWLTRTDEDSLCLSGGTFLNCLANEAISALPQVSRMFIPPASGDDGTAVGAALHVAGRSAATFSAYTGPGYQPERVRAAVEQYAGPGRPPYDWRYVGLCEEYLELAAQDLADDLIIGWFAGRMEFGPRALGNRSILALPNGADIKDRLNRTVKFRESFRPFAPAILDSDYDLVFEPGAGEPTKYMLCTVRVKDASSARVAGAVHVDGSARVQRVTRKDNEIFWKLLGHVKRRTGLGCVINTSFNVKNQPIIMTPELAVDGFVQMQLDRLYIDGFRLSRAGPRPSASARAG
jgi:carbamoyltransferase